MESQRRVFSEQEVADIVQRAAKLQEEANTNKAYTPGVTREELERAANEMGVAQEFLEQAIREKLAGGPPKKAFLKTEERIVEGEMDPGDFDLILEHVKTMAGKGHPTSQVGRMLTAHVSNGAGMAKMSVHSRNGRTRITVKPIPIFEILGTFYPAFVASVISGASLAERGMPMLWAPIAATAMGIASFGFFKWMGRSREKAAQIADKIQEVVEDHVSRQNSPAPKQVTTDTDEALRVRNQG